MTNPQPSESEIENCAMEILCDTHCGHVKSEFVRWHLAKIADLQRRIHELDARCAEMRLAVTDLFAPYRDNPNASLIAVSRERFIRHDNVLSTTAGKATLEKLGRYDFLLRSGRAVKGNK